MPECHWLKKPLATPYPPIWHSLPAYVKDSRSRLDSCLEFIQEIAEIHRLMRAEQRETEESLPHRDQRSLTSSWFEEKLFGLDWVIRSCPLIILPMLGYPHFSSYALRCCESGDAGLQHKCYVSFSEDDRTLSEHLPWRQWNSFPTFFSWLASWFLLLGSFYYTWVRVSKSSILMISLYFRLKLECLKNYKWGNIC